jgi:hypothetical protein
MKVQRFVDHHNSLLLEVYGEDVFDLLDEDRKSLPLRERIGGVVDFLIDEPSCS